MIKDVIFQGFIYDTVKQLYKVQTRDNQGLVEQHYLSRDIEYSIRSISWGKLYKIVINRGHFITKIKDYKGVTL